ncbi:MAG: general stress protein [Beijerinckiaceae bacterium]
MAPTAGADAAAPVTDGNPRGVMSDDIEKPESRKGLASVAPEKRRSIASLGGKSVPSEKRSFSRNRALASAAGKKGGRPFQAETRTFELTTGSASTARRIGRSTITPDNPQAERAYFFLNLYSGDHHILILDEEPSINLERARRKLLDALALQNLRLEHGWRVEVQNRHGDVVLRIRDRGQGEPSAP